MAFCSKCGFRINDEAFCPMCGEKTERFEAPSGEPVSMSKEESIAFAEMLSKEYGELEKMSTEINENKTVISQPIPSVKHHAAFKFFWPYLVAAVVALNVFYIIGYAALLISKAAGFLYVMVLIGFIAAIILLIVGGKTATNKRDSLNIQVDHEVQLKRKKYRELQEKTTTLQNMYSVNKSKLEKYNGMVPLQFRTSRHMDRAKALILTGKAENFSEAVALLPNN